MSSRLSNPTGIAALTATLVMLANTGLASVIGAGSLGDRASSASSYWKPQVGAPWQIILNHPLRPSSVPTVVPENVEIWDLDMYENKQDTISALHARGFKVICYFSAGSYEDWRTDAIKFDQKDLGSQVRGWKGERWVNVSSSGVRDVMAERIKQAASNGCDAIDPDNVDGYENDNGLGLTKADATSFVKFLAEQGHALNMSVGLKNAGSIIKSVLADVDFSVNEQCASQDECSTYSPFIEAGKPVFHIEYPDGAPDVSDDDVRVSCAMDKPGVGGGFSTVMKNMDLDGWVRYCNGTTATTPVDNQS